MRTPEPAITLIGLPGSGKSTLGVLLAKALGVPFIDTDILLQEQLHCILQKYIDTHGFMAMRRQEAELIRQLAKVPCVISTGGSAIYGDAAMRHLASFSTIYYLRIGFALMQTRVGDYSMRGIAFPKDGSLQSMYDERLPFYERFAHVSVDAGDNQSAEQLCAVIQNHIHPNQTAPPKL